MLRFALLWTVLLCSFAAANAQAPDVPEQGASEAIAAATTDTHFISPLVNSSPNQKPFHLPKISRPHHGRAGRTRGTEKPTLMPVRLPRPARACACSRSAKAKKDATSSCSPSPMKQAFATSIVSKLRPRRLADPRRTDQAAAEKLIADLASDLLLQRRAAFRRNRID